MTDEVPGYRILERAGKGGFSVVYRAHQERLDRVVALKVLSVDAVDTDTMRRFERECRITGRLTGHPNIVTVLDTGMSDAGRPFIAMDYFERGSLSDQMSRTGPLPLPDVLRIGVKIAGALAATHDAEVLHRDVKPQNILVSKYGEPVLADFGIARLVSSSEATHTTAFTPQHAAPEVVNGLPPGPASDIYSLASSMYQLLAGNPAFKSGSNDGIGPLMLRILNEPVPPIPRADVPPVVFEAIARAMAKSPGSRFSTAIEFASRLQQVQLELGLPASELARSEPAGGPPAPATREIGRAGLTGPSLDRPVERPGPVASAAPTSIQPPGGPPTAPPMSWASAMPRNAAPDQETPERTRPGPPPTRAFPSPGETRHAYGIGGPGASDTRPATDNANHRRPAIAGALIVVVLVSAGIGVGGLLLLRAQDRSGPPAGTRTGPPTTTASTPASAAVPARVIRAATPRSVRASAKGPVVILHWKLARNNDYPILVQQADETGSRPPLTLPKHTLTTTVNGLDPAKGYCFTVGAVVALGQRDGQSATIAWSRPACVRGASAH